MAKFLPIYETKLSDSETQVCADAVFVFVYSASFLYLLKFSCVIIYLRSAL